MSDLPPLLDDGDVTLYHGDSAAVLATLPEGSVDCVVTSPPYFGLRDYGYDGQIGLEDTPAAFVARLVEVFREVRRVLAPHGTCWVNMGDSFNSGTSARRKASPNTDNGYWQGGGSMGDERVNVPGLAAKQLLGIPWRLAFALQDDGWWLRSDVIWSKPNPMPESVTDRPTKAHEYLFLLTKAPRYYWDADGVREPHIYGGKRESNGAWKQDDAGRPGADGKQHLYGHPSGRNVRTVWTFPTEPNPEAHFATFPRELVRRCLAAGCPERVCGECGVPSVRVVEREAMVTRPSPKRIAAQSGPDAAHHATAVGGVMVSPPRSTTVGWTDCGHGAYRPGVVLDPFIGSGTTAVVARAMGRRCVGIDGSAEYLEIAAKRTQQLSLLGGAA